MLHTPTSTTDVPHLLELARAATEQFRDRKVASANGYRLVGRDLPSMGEHWLNTRLLIDGVLDVSRPELLTYVKVDGRPVLTGVVYAIPLQQGESPPDVFGPEASWHEHNGSVDDEALLPEHHTTPSAPSGTRVAFLHAWVHTAHPDGVFDAENWTIPFVRLGLPVPGEYPNGAARALSLLANGRDFFAALLAPQAEPSSESLDECAARVREIVSAVKASNRGFSAAELQQLEREWRTLVAKVESQSGSEAAMRINGGKH